MSTGDKYRVTLDELEENARIPRRDQVELAETATVPKPDPRGPLPDREWFAAGG